MRASNSMLKSAFGVKDIYRVRFPVYLSNTALHASSIFLRESAMHVTVGWFAGRKWKNKTLYSNGRASFISK
jgi:hypothetical protein